MDESCAQVEKLREVVMLYQVFCEEHRFLGRTKSYHEAHDIRHAHNEKFHRWAAALTPAPGEP